jgi:hypothetical protein
LDIFQYLSTRVDQAELEEVAVIAYKVWLQRNRQVFGGKLVSPICLIEGAKKELLEFHLAGVTPSLFPSTVINSLAFWVKPPYGWTKLNWDAATDIHRNRMGVGLIGRDFLGVVRVCSCSFMPYLTDPAMTEAFAARQGVELCRFMGYKMVIFEGDSQVVVQVLKGERGVRGDFVDIMADTRVLLDFFTNWRVQHVRRTGNVAAHRFARMGVSQNVTKVWFDGCPNSVSDVVCQDLVSLNVME